MIDDSRNQDVYTVECGGKFYIKKMHYFTICEEKNPGYQIIKLICYCFLTNLGIKLPNKKRIIDTIQRFCSNLSLSN